MGMGSAFASYILGLVLNGAAIPNIADNAGSSPLTDVYVSLHTADPGAGGSQTTHEAAYTSYARVAVSRSGWTITSNVASPSADIVFPTATGGSETETFFAIGTASSGAGMILWSGPLSPNISVSSTITPKIKAATTITQT